MKPTDMRPTEENQVEKENRNVGKKGSASALGAMMMRKRM
jgi:hypothetical protein